LSKHTLTSETPFLQSIGNQIFMQRKIFMFLDNVFKNYTIIDLKNGIISEFLTIIRLFAYPVLEYLLKKFYQFIIQLSVINFKIIATIFKSAFYQNIM